MRLSFSPKLLFAIAGILTLLFAGLAADVMHHGLLERYDHVLARQIYAVAGEPNIWLAMFVTGLGSGTVTIPVGVLCGLGLIALRRWRYATFWACTLLGVAKLDALLKNCFHRPRPSDYTYFLTSVLDKSGSFPSGHTIGALVVWGALAYVLARMYPARGLAPRLMAAVAIIVLLVSGGLLCIGVHYLTDILGAYCAGGAWLALCIGVMEWINKKTLPAVHSP